MTPSQSDPSRHADFVRLFAQHAQQLYSQIYIQLGHATDTDDVFQETSKVLWEKFEAFELGTNFSAWAGRIAHFQVLAHRQRAQRNRVWFSDEFIETVAEHAAKDAALLASQHLALSDCLQKLKARDRDLVLRRYRPGATTQGIAQELGRSVDAVYKAINRAQKWLFDCVRRKTDEEV